jgi:hypothetical protein
VVEDTIEQLLDTPNQVRNNLPVSRGTAGISRLELGLLAGRTWNQLARRDSESVDASFSELRAAALRIAQGRAALDAASADVSVHGSSASVWPAVKDAVGVHMNDRSYVTANQTLARHSSRQHDSIELSNHRLNAYNESSWCSRESRRALAR